MATELISYKSIGIEPPAYKWSSGLTPKEAARVDYERIKGEVAKALLDGRLPAAEAGKRWRTELDGLVQVSIDPELYAAMTKAGIEW